jgi:hypothetical protein
VKLPPQLKIRDVLGEGQSWSAINSLLGNARNDEALGRHCKFIYI